jgi:hypothetical protein
MANRKSCIKCGRSIDEFARVCPYCNWYQSQPVPAAKPAPVVEEHAALDPRARTGILSALTFGFLMMVAFTIGAFVRGARPADAAQPAASAPAQPESAHAIVTLVPVTEGAPPPASESPITTVPPQDMTKTLGPSDATALPSQQYAAAAERLRQQQEQATGSVIDPRSITGSPAYEAPVQRPARRVVSNVQTQPVALYQPVPNVRVDRVESAQLSLIVGTDGRVHDIDIQRGAPDVMAPLISEVQRWRFRPATQNGQPISSRFTVNVTFQP